MPQFLFRLSRTGNGAVDLGPQQTPILLLQPAYRHFDRFLALPQLSRYLSIGTGAEGAG